MPPFNKSAEGRMTCPYCGMRQWERDEVTLTCRNGHTLKVGQEPPKLGAGKPVLAAVAAGSATAGFALDFLIRTIT